LVHFVTVCGKYNAIGSSYDCSAGVSGNWIKRRQRRRRWCGKRYAIKKFAYKYDWVHAADNETHIQSLRMEKPVWPRLTWDDDWDVDCCGDVDGDCDCNAGWYQISLRVHRLKQLFRRAQSPGGWPGPESAAAQRWSSTNLAALHGSLGLDVQLSCETDVSVLVERFVLAILKWILLLLYY